jgi:hypothetical protein
MCDACHISPHGRTVRGELIYFSISKPLVCLGVLFSPCSHWHGAGSVPGLAESQPWPPGYSVQVVQTLGEGDVWHCPGCHMALARCTFVAFWFLKV